VVVLFVAVAFVLAAAVNEAMEQVALPSKKLDVAAVA